MPTEKYNSDTKGWTYFKAFINTALVLLVSAIVTFFYQTKQQYAVQTEQIRASRENDEKQTRLLEKIADKVGNIITETKVLSVRVENNEKDIEKNSNEIKELKKRVK